MIEDGDVQGEFEIWLADVAVEWGHMVRDRGLRIRFGQAFANRLYWDRPDISELITGTDLDPYYHNAVEVRIMEFVKENF